MCLLKQDATVEAVRTALADLRDTSNMTLNDVAKMVNRSTAAVSQFVAGKYAGNVEELRKLFIEYLNREHKRRLEKITLPIVHTRHTAGILSVLNLIHESNEIGLIYGSSGFGKTTALEMYAKDNSQTIMLTAYSGITCGAMLMMILELLGLKPNAAGDKKKRRKYYGNQGYLVKMIVDELMNKDILLIVDEAQHLQLKQFEQVRYFHDMANIPVIYAGTDDVLERMVGGKQEVDFDQIYSRCPVVKCIDEVVTKEDILPILEKAKLKVDADILRHLVKKANEKGHFRKFKHIMRNALRFSIKQDEPLGMVHFLAAEELLLGHGKLKAA